MRFLMVTTFYPPFSFGGDAAYVYRLTGELARRGHAVDVAHCLDAYHLLHPQPPPTPASHPPGVTLYSLRSGYGSLSPLLTQQTGRMMLKAKHLRPLLEHSRYDVVHYHNLSLIGLDALTIGQAIKLYTTHEHWLVCPTHVLWKNRREACTSRTCFSCQLISRRPPQWWRHTPLLRRSMRHVDRCLCPSRFTLDKHRELGFDGSMTHLPYFLPRTEAEVGSRPHDRPYALFVGRLERIKGVQNLLRFFRQYRGCDLIIAGDGAYEPELRGMAAGLSHVRFLGRLRHTELRRWYRHALTIVVPSICYEVFGIVLLEAFAVATPALVTPYGALPEVIHDSGGGRVYRDDTELGALLDRLRADRGLRDELGRRGLEAYQRLWTEDPHLSRYLSIIDDARARRARQTVAAEGES